jgi:hypothetical protein
VPECARPCTPSAWLVTEAPPELAEATACARKGLPKGAGRWCSPGWLAIEFPMCCGIDSGCFVTSGRRSENLGGSAALLDGDWACMCVVVGSSGREGLCKAAGGAPGPGGAPPGALGFRRGPSVSRMLLSFSTSI